MVQLLGSMQKVLSLLLAFVFLQVETYALSGGPVFGPGSTTLNVVGTYAGVLIPDSSTATSEDGDGTGGDDAAGTTASASIGLFSIGVAESGPALGAAIVFVAGAAFNGNITGVMDPQDGSFDAVINAVSNFVLTTFVQTDTDDNGNPVFTQVDTNIFAQGGVTAEVTTLSFGGLSSFTPSNTRLEGTASIDVFGSIDPDDGSPIVSSTQRYTVEGFKQSDTVTVAALALQGTGGDQGGGGQNGGF